MLLFAASGTVGGMFWEAKVAVECLQAGSQGPVCRLSSARLGGVVEDAAEGLGTERVSFLPGSNE